MNIVVADDHMVVRKGFQQIVSARPTWRIAAEAADATELFEHLKRGHFDLLLLDVSLGETSGIDVLARVRREYPSLPVLMLSMHPEEQYALRCLKAGARGYIQKDSGMDEILDAISRVARGDKYISDRVASMIADEFVNPSDEPHTSLSAREFEVFRLIARGKTPTQIADMLHLSVKTVSTYRRRILEKTGFTSNADIIAYAIRNSLV